MKIQSDWASPGINLGAKEATVVTEERRVIKSATGAEHVKGGSEIKFPILRRTQFQTGIARSGHFAAGPKH